ncbi:glycoside hydrolase family 13 protein [Prolixibacter denitrificans]|uniref:Alpha-glucosidase n=1 Tax=Prolixibacter denitrificans TaxID=1541063 RepID=A0A2P8CJV8_9BACT|nr:alpha-glucosidase [Prolixibacter denitrificans]PSK85244.1 oligo-1,6-glucosidase [Prolixibacter denitrificans]GET19866.1 alpha-glucosidase [Prolixibacter denitrificans]
MKVRKYFALLTVAILTAMAACQSPTKKDDQSIPNRKWWKEAVVYQIYPRSFKDSNGDGVGDLKGIISKLDYIKSLGVNVIWLNPIYASPNHDNGYDISDYRKIMKEFGTMADFDSLLNGMHRRGLKLVLDLVVNHTSSDHEWFKQSRSSRTNPYRHFYHWWPAEKGKPAKRYSYFDVDNNAWKYDSTTNAYYLHYFARSQPDLNWENPEVRKKIYSMMRYWFDKGIDGFRMDVIPFISKDTTFPPLPKKYHGNFLHYYANGPHLHQYLHEMNQKVLSHYDIMTVAEGAGVTSDEAMNFVDPKRQELNMLYNFEVMGLGLKGGEYRDLDSNGVSLVQFKKIYTKWDSVYGERGWGTIFLGNHDMPRMVTRWGNDSPEYRELSSKMLTTFLLTMHGTPYYYFGDELGMDNIKFDSISDYRDIETLHIYEHIKETGGDLQRFLNNEKMIARDNGRTPFQWDTTANAGFTSGTPWIKVNPNYKTVNEAVEEKDPNSTLNYFRKMVQFRKNNLIMVYGKYELLDQDNPNVYAYTRELNGRKMLILLNFTDHQADAHLPVNMKNAKQLIGNYSKTAEKENPLSLRPYEAKVYQL